MMSVNNPRPQKCQIAGCTRSAEVHSCLCYAHWLEAWQQHRESVIVLATDEDTRPVPAFDADCARAFDGTADVLESSDPKARVMYAAPIRLVRDYSERAEG